MMSNQEEPRLTDVDRLTRLLVEYDCESLDVRGIESIRDLLRGSSDCRKAFVEHQLISAALAQPTTLAIDLHADVAADTDDAASTGSSLAEKPKPSSNPASARVWTRYLGALLAVATALLFVVAGRWLYLEVARLRDSRDTTVLAAGLENTNVDNNIVKLPRSIEATDTGVAMLSRSVDAVWESAIRPEVGEAIPNGTLQLESGLVQLEFFCGATVVVEAPAKLELISSMQARVYHGKLRAQVPPAARGFTLDFQDSKVVDLGTEFAMDVGPDSVNLQVFDGEVELHPAGGEMRLLAAGDAVERGLDGNLSTSVSTPDAFVDISGLQQRARLSRSNQFQRWQKYSAEFRSNPSLIAYYPLDDAGEWHRRLINHAPSRSDLQASELDGAVVGAQRVAGRWDEKSSLEFKRPGDRVRIAIPGEFDSLTFMCWTKIDSLDRWYNSLFLTDGYNAGEPHWQILNTGRVYFSVLPAEMGQGGPRDFKSLSPPFWKPSMSGKWLHVATTYDVAASRITHYLNGEQLSSEAVPAESLVSKTRIGAASIGNWSQPTRTDAQFAIRNLNGSIDELAVFAAALSADEIMEIFEHGIP